MCAFVTSNFIGMRSEALARGAAIMIFAALIAATLATPYIPEDEGGLEEIDDYDNINNNNNNFERFLEQAQEKRASRTYTPMRRSCIRRGGNCDHQFENCCYNSTCRCNLWGSNCRCQRMGLFQKWGK